MRLSRAHVIVSLASMHIFDQDITADKIMWDTRVERANSPTPPLPTRIKPFNHEAFYESHRNTIAVMRGKAHNNETIRKLWSCSTLLRSYYDMYREGRMSEIDLRGVCEITTRTAETFLERENAY